MKLFVIGWGRMGITHTSIIEGIFPQKFSVAVVEPSRMIRLISKRTFGYEFHDRIQGLDFTDSYVIISAPPFAHKEITEYVLNGGAKAVFVEKPYGLFDNKITADERVRVGYVLRFTEVAEQLRRVTKEQGCKKIRVHYESNTIEKKPSGWRNGPYGGVLNEMGSHLIDLIFFVLGSNQFQISNFKLTSVLSDVDDIVFVKGMIAESEFEVSLNWVSKESRKPVWSGMLETLDGEKIEFDQQSISGGFTPSSVKYYVRGREFSKQLEHFIQNNFTIACDSEQANRVHDFISVIKSKK